MRPRSTMTSPSLERREIACRIGVRETANVSASHVSVTICPGRRRLVRTRFLTWLYVRSASVLDRGTGAISVNLPRYLQDWPRTRFLAGSQILDPEYMEIACVST